MQDTKNGPCGDQLTKDLGPSIRVCHLNIEGISRSKCQVLQRILHDNNIDLVAIQETHAEDKAQLDLRGKIHGYDLLGATYDRFYGVATYVRSDIENASLVTTSTENDIHEVVIRIGELTVVNIYKLPATIWPPEVIKTHPHPSMYIGDFNSHHEMWKYSNNDNNGEALVNWAEEQNTFLVFDAKDRGTFTSAAWRRDYNPDLCFVSRDTNEKPLPASRSVFSDFPRSQHRPVIINIGISIPIIRSYPRPRWNLRKADWAKFSKQLDNTLSWVPPTTKNYERFVGAVIGAAKAAIPRGYRKEYIPGWTEKCDELYEEFLESEDREIADELLHNIDIARRQKWTETVENLDFKNSSRQAWSLLRKLGGADPPKHREDKVSPNNVAARMVSTSRAPRDRTHTTTVKRELKALKGTCEIDSEYSTDIRIGEITKALKEMKLGKAPGFDGIHPEFLIYCGAYTKQWLAKLFTKILHTGNIPPSLKRAKIIAILKPGKSNDRPENYRPIALLSMVYKLLERVLLNRISQRILENIPIEQAGFRPQRSCTDQVLSLTTFIEAGFQKKQKVAAAFIDLTAAYDTVWRQGLMYKLIRIIPCKRITDLLDNMLSNRTFQVIMGNKKSKLMKLNNGLPQGSVLAPLLFSLYIADMPETKSRKFGYADDWTLATGHRDFGTAENTLTSDLTALSEYFKKWRLQPSATKTEVSVFHLDNKKANRELRVYLDNELLTHNKHPKYLGVTLDRTLTFKEHLVKTAAKLRTRNNIIHKLCGTTWGSSASTLRSSALGLVYPVAEYCAPVWLNSKHTHMIDTQLNATMRAVTGTIKPTPTIWLPPLSHIAPPKLRREHALVREFKKIMDNPQLHVHNDIPDVQTNRLRSRQPPLKTAQALHQTNFDLNARWKEEWESSTAPSYHSMPCISSKPEGFDLPRKTWSTLNRIRTNCGRCADSLHRWGKLPSAACDCGDERQTVKHIVQECPLRAFAGDPQDFLTATQESIEYISNLDICL